LTEIFRGCDGIVHIAAWHGIDEDRGEKSAYYFFDLNVRGTFEIFEAAASASIGEVIFISTTSVYRPNTRYGSSKILVRDQATIGRPLEVFDGERRIKAITGTPQIASEQKVGIDRAYRVGAIRSPRLNDSLTVRRNR
jgi:nucleoside-diphosphate-sugar epimerase